MTCGCEKKNKTLKTIDTKQKKDLTLRVKQCQNCGWKYFTVEKKISVKEYYEMYKIYI